MSLSRPWLCVECLPVRFPSARGLLVLSRRHGILQPSDELDPDLGASVALQLVLREPALHLQLDHLQRTPDAATDDGTVAQLLVVLRQLDKLRQRVVVEHERELIPSGGPVRDRWLHVQIHPEGELDFVRRFAHVQTTGRAGTRQKVLDQPHAHVVADAFELFVHVLDVLKVAQHLGHERAVREREQLGVLEWTRIRVKKEILLSIV